MSDKAKPPVILLNMAVGSYMYRECEQIISSYVTRVSDSGAVPILIPSIEKEINMETLLDFADGVVLIGGKDYHPSYYGEEPHPETNLTRERPGFDIAFAQAVLRRKMPVLGICAGCQLLNIVTGGKLIQHLPDAEEHTGGTTHQATIRKDGFFSRAVGKKAGETLTVNSFHHQALDPEWIGKDLQITATAFDGSVEAVELPGKRMVLGVQFHPERMDDLAPLIFGLLQEEAAAFAKRK